MVFLAANHTTNAIFDLMQTCDPHSLWWGEVEHGAFDGVGRLEVAFYATECFHSHDGYQIKYSIGIGITLKGIGIVIL